MELGGVGVWVPGVCQMVAFELLCARDGVGFVSVSLGVSVNLGE